jgi:hypothetical protein
MLPAWENDRKLLGRMHRAIRDGGWPSLFPGIAPIPMRSSRSLP